MSRETATRDGHVPSGVRWREVSGFIALAMGLCAAAVLLLALMWGGRAPREVALVAMLTPAIAAFLVVARRPGTSGLAATARATSMWPIRPVRRTVGWCLVGLVVMAGLSLVTVLIGAGTGMVELDLRDFSMLRANMAQTFPAQVAADGLGFPALLPFLIWVLLQVARPLVICVFAFGEELGWRGYLAPALLPLGVSRMLLLSGTVWVAWHLPLFLNNDAAGDGAGGLAGYLVLFTVATAAPQAVVITWLRLASRSVWAPVLMHAGGNVGFMVITIMSEAGTSVNPGFDVAGHDLPLSSLVMAAFAILLLATGQVAPRPDDPAIPSTPANPDSAVSSTAAPYESPKRQPDRHHQNGK